MIRHQMLHLNQDPCGSSDNLTIRISLTIYLQVVSGSFGCCCCPFLGDDSVVAGHLFAPIVFGVLAFCAFVFFGSFLVGNHLAEEERAGPEVIKLFHAQLN